MENVFTYLSNEVGLGRVYFERANGTGLFCLSKDDGFYECSKTGEPASRISFDNNHFVEVPKPKSLREEYLLKKIKQDIKGVVNLEIAEYIVQRPINGISLNGLETASDENGQILTFHTYNETMTYLKENAENPEFIQSDLDNCALLINIIGNES